ncbi:MAG: hypothetical protein JXA67_22280 [Micromonosporaceae bacterium]|nr:hypothetical protein [Micromonosporaceae bacterium]
MSDSIDPKNRSTANMEHRLAQPTAWVLDFTRRMCTAITQGDWAEVEYCATRIASGSEEVVEAAAEAAAEDRPRAAAVIEMIHRWPAQADLFHYAAGHTQQAEDA